MGDVRKAIIDELYSGPPFHRFLAEQIAARIDLRALNPQNHGSTKRLGPDREMQERKNARERGVKNCHDAMRRGISWCALVMPSLPVNQQLLLVSLSRYNLLHSDEL